MALYGPLAYRELFLMMRASSEGGCLPKTVVHSLEVFNIRLFSLAR